MANRHRLAAKNWVMWWQHRKGWVYGQLLRQATFKPPCSWYLQPLGTEKWRDQMCFNESILVKVDEKDVILPDDFAWKMLEKEAHANIR